MKRTIVPFDLMPAERRFGIRMQRLAADVIVSPAAVPRIVLPDPPPPPEHCCTAVCGGALVMTPEDGEIYFASHENIDIFIDPAPGSETCGCLEWAYVFERLSGSYAEPIVVLESAEDCKGLIVHFTMFASPWDSRFTFTATTEAGDPFCEPFVLTIEGV